MSVTGPVLLAASDTGKGSPIGLFVVLLLVIATYLLYRSMASHIRRVPERFPGAGTVDEGAAPARPASATGIDDGAGPGGTAGPDGERTGPS